MNFATKRIRVDGNDRSILMQNENGPCALVALTNVLLLSSHHEHSELLELVQPKKVDLDQLLTVLADIAIATNPKDEELSVLLSLLPQLHTGLNINPRFDGTFEDTKELSVFKLFDIDIIHGWISSDDKVQKYTYEESQQLLTQAVDIRDRETPGSGNPQDDNILAEANLIEQFLNDSSTQLTPNGLNNINTTMKEGNYAVLFRNDHFATITKHNGNTYALVTDLGFRSCNNIVWEYMGSIDGSNDIFFDGIFEETELNDTAYTTMEATERKERVEQVDKDAQLAQQLQLEENEAIQEADKKQLPKKSTIPKTKTDKRGTNHHQTPSNAPYKHTHSHHSRKNNKKHNSMNANASNKKSSDCVVS
ncbi:uncharacterized protein CGFF_01980 [Nakaseomyces glabratus]|nr:MINDY deubiquitinase [Nakaseomyces glabratus]QNG14098.1 uncharacterized protein GWK60_G08965 [Nakaseomyces glabratus]SCV14423.1 uncharacterized protein CGFF_01980 [Nakaseomyces glabratus]SLM13109.1 uncharacterized protein CGFF_01980 [Nakaseomyces glabratus]